MNVDWDRLIIKLEQVFGDDEESLARVLFYLGEEDKEYRETDQFGPAMKILNSSMRVARMFAEYAKNLSEDTKRAQNNERFKRTLGFIYTQMLDANRHRIDNDQNPDLPLTIKMEQMSLEACPGLVRAISIMPYESQRSMMTMMSRILPNRMLTSIEGVMETVSKVGGTMVTVALATVHLTYEAIVNIRRWWRGEISGKRCCKNIIDSLAAIGGSIGGGCAGVAVGTVFGPIGMVVGGLIGGILGGEAAKTLSDWITLNLFDIPKTEALENAYNYFDLNKDASNHAINTAYRQKCLLHHPDKGGSTEKFHLVQINLAVIKAAKGELYQ